MRAVCKILVLLVTVPGIVSLTLCAISTDFRHAAFPPRVESQQSKVFTKVEDIQGCTVYYARAYSAFLVLCPTSVAITR